LLTEYVSKLNDAVHTASQTVYMMAKLNWPEPYPWP